MRKTLIATGCICAIIFASLCIICIKRVSEDPFEQFLENVYGEGCIFYLDEMDEYVQLVPPTESENNTNPSYRGSLISITKNTLKKNWDYSEQNNNILYSDTEYYMKPRQEVFHPADTILIDVFNDADSSIDFSSASYVLEIKRDNKWYMIFSGGLGLYSTRLRHGEMLTLNISERLSSQRKYGWSADTQSYIRLSVPDELFQDDQIGNCYVQLIPGHYRCYGFIDYVVDEQHRDGLIFCEFDVK